jgi:undecaprenyl pyrophosphate phosphatase UppP
VSDGIPAGFGGAFVAGMVASAVSGFLVIALLLSYLRRRDLSVFLWYRLAAALLVFGVIAFGVRSATL